MNNPFQNVQKEKVVEFLKKNLWGILLFALLLVIDLVTKIVAEVYFTAEDAPLSIPIIPGYLELCLAYNRGMSFSIGATAPTWLKIAVIMGTCVMFIALGVFFFKVDRRRVWLRVAFVMVVAGGIGNFIDRVYYQVWNPDTFPYGVRDMVRLKIWFMDFGVCNFADFFIVGGAIVLALALLFFDRDAMFPVGKYKAMAKEQAEFERAQQEKKKSDKKHG